MSDVVAIIVSNDDGRAYYRVLEGPNMRSRAVCCHVHVGMRARSILPHHLWPYLQPCMRQKKWCEKSTQHDEGVAA